MISAEGWLAIRSSLSVSSASEGWNESEILMVSETGAGPWKLPLATRTKAFGSVNVLAAHLRSVNSLRATVGNLRVSRERRLACHP